MVVVVVIFMFISMFSSNRKQFYIDLKGYSHLCKKANLLLLNKNIIDCYIINSASKATTEHSDDGLAS